MQYTYETVGNSSYLVAAFPGGEGIINYQLQMLVNNDIKNIIKVNKRQKNDDVLISYNITSRIALSQIDTKNKIPKLGLINIIEGALATLEDIEEYQLVSSGIVFDEEYIFVKPGSYEPNFVYIPVFTDDTGIEPLKKFVLSLIMGSKVEMTNDNFIQTLLDTLNNPALSAKDLHKLCTEYKTGKSSAIKQVEKIQPAAITPPTNLPENQDSNNALQQPVQQQPVVQQHVSIPIHPPVQQNKNSIMEKPIPQSKEKEEAAKENKQSKEKQGSGLKKTLFFILQLLILGIIIVVYLSGFLNNADGSLNVTYLLGIALALGAADFVLYREMFNNNVIEDGKKKEAKPAKNNTKKPAVSIPGKEIPEKPAIPGKEMQKPPVAAPIKNVLQPPVQQEPQVVEQPVQPQVQIPVAHAIPQTNYVAPVQAQQYNAMAEFESEDTVVLDDNNAEGAYLEYFENGLSTKIKLTKDAFMIGKLRGQCDFILNNNKISKMHAEFITRGTDYFIKDYNSTNGTYINGSAQRIASNVEYQIFNGDRITLANVEMTFRC